jgi:hypothetical protein
MPKGVRADPAERGGAGERRRHPAAPAEPRRGRDPRTGDGSGGPFVPMTLATFRGGLVRTAHAVFHGL